MNNWFHRILNAIRKVLNSPFTLGVLLLASVLMALFNLPQTSRQSRVWFARLIQNRWENFIPCETLPFYEQVEKAFAQHLPEVEKIKQISGVADFAPDMVKCMSADNSFYFLKGQAVVKYRSWLPPEFAVHRVLGSQEFFGIPLRGEKINK